MKKVILVVLVLMLLLVALAPLRLVRLTTINKSGWPINVQMTGKEFKQPYYLQLEKGSRSSPETNIYTILPDRYKVNIYFNDDGIWKDCISELIPVRYWDWEAESVTLDFRGNSKLVITECGYPPPNLGDPGVHMYKWYWKEMYIY